MNGCPKCRVGAVSLEDTKRADGVDEGEGEDGEGVDKDTKHEMKDDKAGHEE